MATIDENKPNLPKYEKVLLSDHDAAKTLLEGIVLASNASSAQQLEEMKQKNTGWNDALPDLDNLHVSDKMLCVTCDVSFSDRQQQVSHYRSDWHRFNIKQKLRGQKSVSEVTFSEITGDISSISGSESESEEERPKEDVTAQSETPAVIEDQMSYHIEGIGRHHPRTFFKNSEGQLLSVYRSVVYGKRNTPESESELISMAANLPKQLKWVVLMVAGGHFAAAVFQGEKIIIHKTFHRYVVRAKRGTAQSAHDSQGGHAKSVGAFMRRHHEAALYDDIRQLLQEWSEHMKLCDIIFLRATGSNRTTLFSGKKPILDKKDPRIRLIPFPTRRPTFNEVKRAHSELITLYSYGVDSEITDHISPKKTKLKPERVTSGRKGSPVQKQMETPNLAADETESSSDSEIDLIYSDHITDTRDLQPFECTTRKERKRKKKKPKSDKSNGDSNIDYKERTNDNSPTIFQKDLFYGLRNELYTAAKTGNCNTLQELLQKLDGFCREEGKYVQEILNEPIDKDGGTLLHVASSADHPAIIRILLESGTDPTVRDNSGQFPYVICKDKETRYEYRRFMADFPEKYNYAIAQVPGPLTKEMEEEKRAKEAEKRRLQKKAKKEKMKVQKEEQKKQKAEEVEKQKFLSMSDRDKRALAAEKRLAAQLTKQAPNDSLTSRCFECGEDMTGKVPFEYSDNKFCSTKCLQKHRKSTHR